MEPNPSGWWWAIKHFPTKMLQEPLWSKLQYAAEHSREEGQYLRATFQSLVLNKGIELQYALHIWRETL